jgi:predicted NUDIX family NTP pyrophosphohydrolase
VITVPAVSAGVLLFRRVAPGLEVLLVHPGGPYWAKKDAGAWSIPKGEAEPDELETPQAASAEPWRRPAKVKPRLMAAAADLLAVARREFREETGFDPDTLAAPGAAYVPLGGVKQRGHKIVYVWALEGDCDASSATSESFAMEWPPHSGERASFPEADRAAWFGLAPAREKLVAGQRRFLDDLEALAGAGSGPPPGLAPPGGSVRPPGA